jgi:hypothetical protein
MKYYCNVCKNEKPATLHLYGKGYCKICKEFTSTDLQCLNCEMSPGKTGMPCYHEPCNEGIV